MKFSLNSIRKYTTIQIPDDKLITKIGTQIGEVEDVEQLAEKYQDIVLAEIVEKQDHPDSDKLGIYKVNIGETVTQQVVAGDRSLEIGDKVAYFKIGAKLHHLPADESGQLFEIKQVKLRGVESNGMMASAKELGFSNDHSKVLRIQTEAAPGTSIIELFDLDDTVVDVENKALTNRPDLFGLIGMSREVAGIQNIPFKSPDWYLNPQQIAFETVESESTPFTLDNDAPQTIQRFVMVAMESVTVGTSPIWLQSLLIKSGLKPINNVVDISNYIMLLLGQPMHMYDYDKVINRDKFAQDKANIIVRYAKSGEKLQTLDGKLRELDDKTLVVADTDAPISILGVMGGQDSEVDESTKRVLIEAANIDLYNVRKTSMRLGIFTDAVTRFSRGQDTEQCLVAIYEAVRLMQEIAGAKVASKIADSYENPKQARSVLVKTSALNEHIGLEFTSEQIKTLLENVELKVEFSDDDSFVVQVPTWRNDLLIPQDIHEEVARLYNYNKIPVSLPLRGTFAVKENPLFAMQRKLREILKAAGANEILTYNFVGKDLFEKTGQELDSAFHITNALSPDLEFMKTSLTPTILEKAQLNIQAGVEELALFEINKSHNKKDAWQDELPVEQHNLALVFSAQDKTVEQKYSGSPYYQAKVYAERISMGLNVNPLKFALISDSAIETVPLWIQNLVPLFDANSSAFVLVVSDDDEVVIGILGNLKLSVKRNFKLPDFTCALEIDINELIRLQGMGNYYIEPSRFPEVSQDLCFRVESDLLANEILALIKNELSDIDNLQHTQEIIDIYQSEDKSVKQITVRVNISDRVKALSEGYIKKIYDRVVKKVVAKFKATLV